MKKTLLICLALGLTAPTFAQDRYVTAALTALSQKDYEEAKSDIDKAMSSPETNTKPKALWAKSQVYFELNGIDKYKNDKLWKDAAQSLLKLVELKPEFQKEEVNNYLFVSAIYYFNDGINAYNATKYTEAEENLKNALKICELEGGNRFAKFASKSKLDTLGNNATMQLGRIAYSMQSYEEAIKIMNKLNAKPETKSVDNYIILLESYDKYNTNNANKMTAEEGAAINDARASYPDNDNLRNIETNYYAKNNKTNELIKKLEENIAKYPNNADMLHNLGLAYLNSSKSKDGKGASDAENVSKSEGAFKKALKLSPDNAIFNYNLGSLYYGLAYEQNKAMNDITGTTKADFAKADVLQKKRDEYFNAALPFMEKAYSVLSVNEPAKMKSEDKETYRNSLIALVQIYSVKNVTDKVSMYKGKLDAMK